MLTHDFSYLTAQQMILYKGIGLAAAFTLVMLTFGTLAHQLPTLAIDTVQSLAEAIKPQLSSLDRVSGKPVTLVLGQTGPGKTCIVNILGGVKLRLSKTGTLGLDPKCAQSLCRVGDSPDGFLPPQPVPCPTPGLLIGGGSKSVTAVPQSLESSILGTIYDLPGFEDTNGALHDLLTAGMLREITKRASAIRVLLVISEDEIVSQRGRAVKSLMSYLTMFPEDFQKTSVFLVVNKLKPRSMHTPANVLSDFLKEYPILNELIQTNKLHGIPDMGLLPEDTNIEAVLKEHKALLEKKVSAQIKLTRPSQVTVSMTLGTETSQTVCEYFTRLIDEKLQQISNQWEEQAKFLGGSERLEEKKDIFRERFVEELSQLQDVKILTNIADKQYNQVLSGIMREEGPFESKLSTFISELQKRETEQRYQEAERQRQMAELEVKKTKEEAEMKEKARVEADRRREQAERNLAVERAKIQKEKEEAIAKEKQKVLQEHGKKKKNVVQRVGGEVRRFFRRL